jgi:hypothetical protein
MLGVALLLTGFLIQIAVTWLGGSGASTLPNH